jgi:hypothetical protein
MRRTSGSILVNLLVIGAVVILFIAVIAVPGLLSSARASNERSFTVSLKTLAAAEADFRANDRDWNHLNDFWTADVKGLYTMTSAVVAGATPGSTTDPSIKLIELSIASADADETFFPAGGDNLPLSVFSLPAAKARYWYAALRSDLSTTPPTSYAQHAQGKVFGERVRHESKFGFVGFPDSQSAGKYIAIVNESNRIYRTAATTLCRTPGTNPPGVAGIPSAYLNWPDESTLKSMWSKLD